MRKLNYHPSRHRTVFSANSSATPALRGNEVNMDTIVLGNNESLVYGVFPNQDGTFTAMTYTKSKTFKTESGARCWLARNTD
ncbi:phage protein [Escherichia coli]|nr:phage protein [Escherichia coli]